MERGLFTRMEYTLLQVVLSQMVIESTIQTLASKQTRTTESMHWYACNCKNGPSASGVHKATIIT